MAVSSRLDCFCSDSLRTSGLRRIVAPPFPTTTDDELWVETGLSGADCDADARSVDDDGDDGRFRGSSSTSVIRGKRVESRYEKQIPNPVRTIEVGDRRHVKIVVPQQRHAALEFFRVDPARAVQVHRLPAPLRLLLCQRPFRRTGRA